MSNFSKFLFVIASSLLLFLGLSTPINAQTLTVNYYTQKPSSCVTGSRVGAIIFVKNQGLFKCIDGIYQEIVSAEGVIATEAVAGRIKVSIPPVNPLNPIAVGDNDPRLTIKANKDDIGHTTTDVNPDDSELPIAVGSNSPRVRKVLELECSNNLNSTCINTTLAGLETDLVVKSDTTITASLTIPDRIRIVPENNAVISVNSGQTLTITNMADVGNRQIFGGVGTVRLMPRAVKEFNLSWWHGTDTSTNIKTALDAALANISTNNGGVLYIPQGVWITNGLHTIPSFTRIYGAGFDGSSVGGTSIKLASGQTPAYIFKTKAPPFFQITVAELTIDCNVSTVTTGFLIENTATTGLEALTSIGIELNKVAFRGTGVGSPAQLYLKDASNSWEILMVKLYGCAFTTPNDGLAFKTETANTNISIDQALVYVYPGAVGFWFQYSANTIITNSTFNGVANVAFTSTLDRTVTGSITSGTKNLTLNSGTLTNNDIGQRVIIDGRLDSYITDVTGSTTATVFHDATATASANNLEIYRFAENTAQGDAAIHITAPHSNIKIVGSQTEGVNYFVKNDASQRGGVLSLDNNIIQGEILLNHTITIHSAGNTYLAQTYRDGASSDTNIFSHGDSWDNRTNRFYLDDALNRVDITLTNSRRFGVRAGSSKFITDFGDDDEQSSKKFNDRVEFKQNYEIHGANPQTTTPFFSVGSFQNDKVLARFGRLDQVTNDFDFYYDIKRASSGYLTFDGNQTGFIGYDFDGVIQTSGNLTTSKSVIRSTSTALTSSATIAVDASLGDRFSLTSGHTANINVTNATAGQELTFVILTSGTSPFTLTWNTNFKSQGTLSTGSVDAKYFVIKFTCVSNVLCIEASRTTAM